MAMAGVDPQTRRVRRPWHRWTGPLALRGANRDPRSQVTIPLLFARS
jgi:hypothetical protein